MPTSLSYERFPDSDQVGCIRTFANDYMLETRRGKLRADEVQVGDEVRTTPRYFTKILNVQVEAE